jgi:DNA primase
MPSAFFMPTKESPNAELGLYYKAIADWILPHVGNRSLTLLRCPEGSERTVSIKSTRAMLCMKD